MVLLRRALEDWGIDADRDVTIRDVGDRPQLWAALERGEIAAFAVTAPLFQNDRRRHSGLLALCLLFFKGWESWEWGAIRGLS